MSCISCSALHGVNPNIYIYREREGGTEGGREGGRDRARAREIYVYVYISETIMKFDL